MPNSPVRNSQTTRDRLGTMNSLPTTARSLATPLHTVAEVAAQFGLNLFGVGPTQAENTAFCGLAVGSSEVEPGKIFVALQGLKSHGARFAAQAVERGAVAILTDQEGAQLLSRSESPKVRQCPVLVSPPDSDLRELMARCAAWCHENPSHALNVAGVTGTNGKTTTTFFLDAILRGVGQRTGLIGTIEMRLGDLREPAVRTTVEAPVLQEFFANARHEKIDSISMEVSSHAISLHRITGTRFAVVGFTNLQRDHLDFHHTMQEYFEAKAALFTPEFSDVAVINVDDEYGWRLVNQTPLESWSIATDPNGPYFDSATWRTVNAAVTPDGTGVDFDLVSLDGKVIATHSPLLGSVNVANAGLATLMALKLGIPADRIKQGLVELGVVPGRMEIVSLPGQPKVIVDYAHTTEALEFALTSLGGSHLHGELTVVFGAAGERDASKRPEMGRVTVELADKVLVTDDDPYGEDRATIRSQILAGARDAQAFRALPPEQQAYRLQDFAVREDAITHAIKTAKVTDTVLIAGRGHETIQDLDGEQHVLDDRAFARAQLARFHPLD